MPRSGGRSRRSIRKEGSRTAPVSPRRRLMKVARVRHATARCKANPADPAGCLLCTGPALPPDRDGGGRATDPANGSAPASKPADEPEGQECADKSSRQPESRFAGHGRSEADGNRRGGGRHKETRAELQKMDHSRPDLPVRGGASAVFLRRRRRLSRGQHHNHLPAFHLRALLHLGDRIQLVANPR